ncbi:hypothetical protein ACMFMF_007152 [Clarireedia jacksonii]
MSVVHTTTDKAYSRTKEKNLDDAISKQQTKLDEMVKASKAKEVKRQQLKNDTNASKEDKSKAESDALEAEKEVDKAREARNELDKLSDETKDSDKTKKELQDKKDEAKKETENKK